MNTDKNRLNSITEVIIGCAYKVANGLGCGFLEKVYENALLHELRKAGMTALPIPPAPMMTALAAFSRAWPAPPTSGRTICRA